MTNRTLAGFSLVTDTRLTRAAMTAVLVAAVLTTSIGCGRIWASNGTNLRHSGPVEPPEPAEPAGPRAGDGHRAGRQPR